MSVKDGGSAFPVTFIDGPSGQPCAIAGATLRDYFAAKATDQDVKAAMRFGESWEVSEDRACARFRHADAMLRAREVQS